MSELRFDPPEVCTLAELRVGDYVTKVHATIVRPERRVESLQRPMIWNGKQEGLWGVGLADGTAIAVGGDGAHIYCERLAPSEAERRDRMNAALSATTRDGKTVRVAKLIV